MDSGGLRYARRMKDGGKMKYVSLVMFIGYLGMAALASGF